MKAKSIIYLLGIAFFGVLPGCTSEFDQPEPIQEEEVTEVDINISFGSDWPIDMDNTRAVPPGTGGNNDPDIKIDGDEDLEGVDKVRVIAFKRREDTEGSFIYDVRNDQILDVNEETKEGTDGKPERHNHLTAQGKLKKTYGFEYRVIAVAYSSQKENLYKDIDKSDKCTFSMPDGEQNWFSINTDTEPTYEDVLLSLNYNIIPSSYVDQTSWRDFMKWNGPSYNASDINSYESNTNSLSRNVIQVPQLFYGILHSKSGSEIIGYSETDENGDMKTDLSVSGILYRGVAKLEVKLKLKKSGNSPIINPFNTYKWIALLADNVTTDVHLSSYDDFLLPAKEGLAEGYTAVNYWDLRNGYTDGEYVKIETWFLPTTTRLALRIKGNYQIANNIKNFQIKTTDPIYSTGNGTGIMSPDVVDGVFYFRRNHKYILEVDVDKLMNSKYELK